jgi:hypothetical protein
MSEPTDVDLEHEKGKSYELGRLSQFQDLADELRERAGELWASDSRRDTTRAKELKDLAQEYENRYEEERERWEEKYNE